MLMSCICFFFFKQKTAYEIRLSLVGSEMCIRDSREAERLAERLEEAGKEIVQYATGRRGVSYYTFRHRELAARWTGDSDGPTHAVASEVAAELLRAFVAPVE